MTRISKNTKKAIHGLATAYQAYVAALMSEDSDDRDCGLSTWGEILIARQTELGVEMLESDGVRYVVDAARDRRAARQKVAA